MKNVYCHTKKAIKHGHPAERIFIQVGTSEGCILAWKCEKRAEGIYCPWSASLKSIEEAIKEAPLKGDNGSVPTALFKLDSYYQVYKH